ncbi:MAG: prepilin-type N-terminal cleavage/methylation domain-containing protein [Gammaproteobacteria bacterium]
MSKNAPTSRRRNGGFTLLEMLVGLTLFALLAYTAYAGLRIGSRSWEAGNTRTEELSDLRVALGFVDQYVGRALPLAVRDRGRWHVEFEGREDSVEFMTEMAAHLGVGGVYHMGLHVEDGQDGKRLIMRRRLYGAEERDLDAREARELAAYYTERVLAEKLESVRFEYFGLESDTARKRDKPEWVERWTERRALPLAVRVSIEDERGEWPEQISRLQLSEIQFIRTGAEDDDADLEADELIEELEAEGELDPDDEGDSDESLDGPRRRRQAGMRDE